MTTRFEVALRLWDERTRLSQYVLKRNRVARPDDAHPHPAVDTLLRRRHAFLQAQQAELFTVSLYLVVLVEAGPAGDGVGESGASRAARSRSPRPASGSRPRARSSGSMTTSTGGACSCATRSTPSCSSSRTRSAPRVLSKARGLHVLPASPELHAGEGGRRPPPRGHLSRLRHLRLRARVSSDASAPR